MKEKLLSISSVVPAIFAALCWSGGLILGALGLGTVGLSFFSRLSPYRNIFILITGVILFVSYRIIEKNKVSNTSKIIFWLSAIISILILYSPTLITLFQK